MNELHSLDALDPPAVAQTQYDGFIAMLGYEARSRYAGEFLQPHAARRTACAFPERQIVAFRENQTWFENAGFEIPTVLDNEVEEWSESWLRELTGGTKKTLHIAVDISSMSRLRLASMLAAVMRLDGGTAITVDFVYSIAKWCAPSEDPEPIVTVGAVLPFYAGWSNEPNLPVVAVIGLGYEPDKAVGAYEYLEATKVWAFLPRGSDARYIRDVNRANQSLLTRIPAAQQITYAVNQPLACFSVLEGIIYGSFETGRPVLLPFGPKIFALCCLLVSCLHRDVPVWRISSGQFGEAIDRVASGELIALRARFQTSAAR